MSEARGQSPETAGAKAWPPPLRFLRKRRSGHRGPGGALRVTAQVTTVSWSHWTGPRGQVGWGPLGGARLAVGVSSSQPMVSSAGQDGCPCGGGGALAPPRPRAPLRGWGGQGGGDGRGCPGALGSQVRWGRVPRVPGMGGWVSLEPSHGAWRAVERCGHLAMERPSSCSQERGAQRTQQRTRRAPPGACTPHSVVDAGWGQRTQPTCYRLGCRDLPALPTQPGPCPPPALPPADGLTRGDGLTCGTAPHSPRGAAVCRWRTPPGSETAPPACAGPGPEGNRGTAVGSQWEERSPRASRCPQKTFPAEGRAGSAPRQGPLPGWVQAPSVCVGAGDFRRRTHSRRDGLPPGDQGQGPLPLACPRGQWDLGEVGRVPRVCAGWD